MLCLYQVLWHHLPSLTNGWSVGHAGVLCWPHGTPSQSMFRFLTPLSLFPWSSVVPKKLLQEPDPRAPVDPPSPSAHDPNVVGDSAPPQGTVVRPSDALPDQPERAALFFVCGVCLGLFLTLFALVVQISCRTDCPARPRPSTGTSSSGGGGGGVKNKKKKQKKKKNKRARLAAGGGGGGGGGGGSSSSTDSDSDSSSGDSDSDSDWDAESDLSARRRRRFERTLNTNVFTSAEELERAQRLEERERIIREIWMNGQPDVPGTRSLNRYY
ncbi:hypothetical protein NHX12_025995 [Muraenolepis orangiensis]|uniref:EVA1 domain-containing protein n=1 Tax=Muraenolepis orangiensis TaxID=630683 RepID=A0A9Q0IPW5_9TELE|nr:hypothetical protein NHX12_025995 [Muraenolepis orangiensis]